MGSKGREKVKALFESGATYPCIQEEIGEKFEIVIPLLEAFVLSFLRGVLGEDL